MKKLTLKEYYGCLKRATNRATPEWGGYIDLHEMMADELNKTIARKLRKRNEPDYGKFV